VKEIRLRMSDISWWIRLLSQKIAQRANKDDGEVGKFWQARYNTRPRTRELLSSLVVAWWKRKPSVRSHQVRDFLLAFRREWGSGLFSKAAIPVFPCNPALHVGLFDGQTKMLCPHAPEKCSLYPAPNQLIPCFNASPDAIGK
jgi:hypothetical protein